MKFLSYPLKAGDQFHYLTRARPVRCHHPHHCIPCGTSQRKEWHQHHNICTNNITLASMGTTVQGSNKQKVKEIFIIQLIVGKTFIKRIEGAYCSYMYHRRTHMVHFITYIYVQRGTVFFFFTILFQEIIFPTEDTCK